MTMTVGEFQGLVATVGFNAAEAALNAAGGFSTPAPEPAPVPAPAPLPDDQRNTGTISQYQYDVLSSLGQDMTGFTVAPEWSDPASQLPSGQGAANQQELVHAYNPPNHPTDPGEYHGLMSAADAAWLNLVVGEAPTTAAAPAAASGDQQILDLVKNGTIIETSRLAEIGDVGIRTEAANLLAKLLVGGLGHTQASVQELGKIYTQFISGEGALNFSDWTTAAGLDWAQVPEPGAIDPRDTAVEGGYGDISDDVTGTFGDSPGMAMASAQGLQGTDKDIFDFLTGLYKKQSDQGTSSADILTAMLNEGADTMIGSAGLFGQTFTDRNDAYSFLSDWLYSPTKGNINTVSGTKIFTDAAMALPPWTGLPSTAVTPPASVPSTAGPGGFDMGGLAAYGTPESLRPFGQIYPGFTSLLPGYTTSPALQGAYQQAGAPLETQYLAQQALTPGAPPGTGIVGNDIQSWLQGVQAGTQPLTMGQDYASFLNQLTGALGSPAGAPVAGMDPMVQMKLTGLFQDPGAQLAAFTNPFYQATSGSPQVRNALMNQIQQAAQRYQYQEPSGAFLPWAIEQNIGGIQSILPSLQGWAPPA